VDIEREANMITSDELRKIMHYNPDTGFFTWHTRENPKKGWNKKYAGKYAGSKMVIGYWSITINNKRYLRHRLAWLYMTGRWPIQQIDHISGDRGDDRFCNLREATISQNRMNRDFSKKNTSGYIGVRKHVGGLWQVRVKRNGKIAYCAYFKEIEEAAAARAAWLDKEGSSFHRL
jgi:hypothetical protein